MCYAFRWMVLNSIIAHILSGGPPVIEYNRYHFPLAQQGQMFILSPYSLSERSVSPTLTVTGFELSIKILKIPYDVFSQIVSAYVESR
jgi:hypothetical protein